MTDDPWPDATAQAELVRLGRATPFELVQDAVDRLRRVDPQLGAVVREQYDAALARARGPLPDGPFRGVPMLLKDLGAHVAGEVTGDGTSYLEAVPRPADSAVARALRAAGFVSLGRSRVPELATTVTTEPAALGPTRNPWDPTRTAGGSSGGSAAAVAAGAVAVASASDGGGSIRIPASACGLVGLKPSRGRISSDPAGESWAGATTDGVLTRTVRDTAALLDVLAGPQPGDPYSAPPPSRPYVAEVGADPGRLRIGLLDSPPQHGRESDPDSVAAVARTADLLARLGHQVEPACPQALGDPAFARHFNRTVGADVALMLAGHEALLGRPVADEELEPRNRAYRGMGRRDDRGRLPGEPGLAGRLHPPGRGLVGADRAGRRRVRPAPHPDGARGRAAARHAGGPRCRGPLDAVRRAVQRHRTAGDLAAAGHRGGRVAARRAARGGVRPGGPAAARGRRPGAGRPLARPAARRPRLTARRLVGPPASPLPVRRAALSARRIDLHTHSTASDGTTPPERLGALAREAGLDVVALTDHDTTAGLAAAAAALPAGVALVPGAELSCTSGGISLHLLAYLFDPDEPELAAALATLRESRRTRAQRIVASLAAAGTGVTWEQVSALAAGTVGRPHVAQALVERGVVPTVADAFTADWIGAGGRHGAGRYELDVAEAVALVARAGGVTVFAHPGAAARGRTVPDSLYAELAAVGLSGLEVDHPDHDEPTRRRLRGLAGDLGLVATGSSDFHGAHKTVALAAHTTDEDTYERLVSAARGVPVVAA